VSRSIPHRSQVFTSHEPRFCPDADNEVRAVECEVGFATILTTTGDWQARTGHEGEMLHLRRP
jgi:hypothetical protein